MRLLRFMPVLAAAVLLPCVHAQPRKIGAGARPMGKPAGPVEKLSKLPPDQRKKQLEKLPPERRAKVEHQLEKFNELSPQEQERLKRQAEAFQKMPLQKQQAFRQGMKQFNLLPEPRQTSLRGELNTLSHLSDAQRRARMNSDEFRNKYTANEKQILDKLSSAYPVD
jgi:hypothetical protein